MPDKTTETQAESLLPWHQENWSRLSSQLKQQRLAHAYLLCGEHGLGKKKFAAAVARLLLCDNPSTTGPCENCNDCRFSVNATHPDLLYVTPEEGGRVLKVDQVRALTRFTEKTTHSARRKVVILEQADMLNMSAANALLKTLEEPAGNTVILLLSDKPGSLLPTIRSRCQRILFITPEPAMALTWLQETLDGKANPQELLHLAGGKPILAQEIYTSGEVEQRQNIIRAFVQIVDGNLDPIEFAATFKSLNVSSVMDYLWQTSALLIKYLLCKDEALLASSEIRAIVTRLQQSGRDENDSLTRLLRLNLAAEDAKRQLVSVSNPNQQLIFESMMWRWSRISG